MLGVELKLVAIAFAAGALIATGGTWRIVAKSKDKEHAAAIVKINADYAVAVKEADDRALNEERAKVKLATKIEVEDAENKQTVARLAAENRRLMRDRGGLHDPYAAKAACAGADDDLASAKQLIDSTAQGRLSDEAAGFLLDFAADADEVAEWAASCHRWVMALDRQ